jgi:hypothetical protein
VNTEKEEKLSKKKNFGLVKKEKRVGKEKKK